MLWNKYSGGDVLLGSFWKFFKNFKIRYFVYFCIVVFMLRISWIFIRKINLHQYLHRNSLLSVAVSGFTAMGLEIILLYGFQNLFGSLYQNIALVTSIFMFGFASVFDDMLAM